MKTVDVYLDKAKSQKGVSEVPKGSNRGPIVDKYIEYTGLDPSGKYPWCACFVSWVLGTSIETKLFNTADCDIILNFGNKKGIVYSSPKRGDLFLILRSDSDAFHVGFVLEATSNSFVTLEGNSNSEGSHEGYEVISKTRYLNGKQTYKFVRISDILPEKTEDWVAEFPNGKKIDLINISDINYCYVRDFFTILFSEKEVTKNILCDTKTKTVSFQGKEIGKYTVLNNKAYFPIRTLTEFSGLEIKEVIKTTVYIVKKEAD